MKAYGCRKTMEQTFTGMQAKATAKRKKAWRKKAARQAGKQACNAE